MLEPGLPGQGLARAFLRLAGASLARHQLGVARALGCQRVICMARGAFADLIALQHEAEAAGMKFHILPDAAGLPALVTASDELLVLSEGLLVDPDSAGEQLDERSCILVQPAEGAVEAGFERIDANCALAGVMLVPGHLAERLHDLPSDCDVASALTRIALQHGVRRKNVSATARVGARWRMIASEAEAQAAETEWLKEALDEDGKMSPGFLCARAVASTLGPSLLHTRNGLAGVAVMAAVVLALALGLSWTGLGAAALALCAAAWLLLRLYGMLARVERRISRAREPLLVRSDAPGWLFDLALVLILAWEVVSTQRVSIASACFAPIVLILLLRIAAGALDNWRTSLSQDRGLLCLLLAAIAISGMILYFIQFLTIMLALVVISGRSGLRS